MAIQKMVFKIPIYCGKCKTAVLKAVARLEGIDQVTIDAEKGTLTVIGEVDPVCVVKNLRKIRPAYIESVGPNKPPEKKEEKKDDKPLPLCCKSCSGNAILFVDTVPGCTIV